MTRFNRAKWNVGIFKTFIRELQVRLDLGGGRGALRGATPTTTPRGRAGRLPAALEQVVDLLVVGHLGGAVPTGAAAAAGVAARLLELLEEVAPLVGAHGRGAVEALLPHLGGDGLPEVLVGLGGVEVVVHLAAQRDEAERLVLDPGLGALLRGRGARGGVVVVGAAVLAAALREQQRRGRGLRPGEEHRRGGGAARVVGSGSETVLRA